MEKLDKIHAFLEDNRLLNKISYDKMAEAINYSGPGLKKALKNKTLSIIQINTIIKEFSFETYFKNEFGREILETINSLSEPIAEYKIDKKLEDIIAQKVSAEVYAKLKPHLDTIEKQGAVLAKIMLQISDLKDKITD